MFFKKNSSEGGGGFSYINPEIFNRRAIIIFVLEASAFLILVGVIMGVLSYFKILDLSKLFPPQAGPHKDIPFGVPKAVDTNAGRFQTRPSDLIKKDKDGKQTLYGYTVLWIGGNDTTGRTIIYDDNVNRTAPQLLSGRLNGIGRVFDVPLDTPKHIVGSFVRFDNAPNKKESYMILKNPLTDQILPKILINKAHNGTRVVVEDIAYGPEMPLPDYGFESELAGFVEDYPDLSKIIQPQDAIIALLPVEAKEAAEYRPSAIVLRRLGGKISFQQEMK